MRTSNAPISILHHRIWKDCVNVEEWQRLGGQMLKVMLAVGPSNGLYVIQRKNSPIPFLQSTKRSQSESFVNSELCFLSPPLTEKCGGLICIPSAQDVPTLRFSLLLSSLFLPHGPPRQLLFLRLPL